MPVVPYSVDGSASSSGGSQDPNVDTSKFKPYSGTVSIPDAAAKTSVDSPAPAAPSYGPGMPPGESKWKRGAAATPGSDPGVLEAVSTGVGTALMEPVFGVAQMIPGVLGLSLVHI